MTTFKSFAISLALFVPSISFAQTAVELHEKAMSYKNKDNLTEAWRQLGKALELDPQNEAYKAEMADIQYVRKAFFESIPLYEEMLAKEPKNLTYLARLAEMYSMSPQKMKGVTHAENALKLNPTDPAINRMLARTFMEVQHFPKAVKLYLEAEKSLPNDKDIPFKIANCYEKMSRYRDAMIYFNKALALDPENTTKMYEAATANYNANQYREAISLFQKAEDNGYYKSKTLYENWALCYVALKDFDQGIFYYMKAKDYAPYDKNLNLDISDTYIMSGNFKKAREVLNSMLDLNEEDAEVLYTMGMTYYREGNTSKAENYFNKAFALDPSLKSLRYSKSNF